MRVSTFWRKTLFLMLLLGSFACFPDTIHAQPSQPLQPALGPQNSGQYADAPEPGQVHINAGSTSGYVPEQYLSINSGSTAAVESYGGCCGRPPNQTTYRYVDGSGEFGYHIPIAASTSAPVYLSLLAAGKIKLTVGGSTVLLNNTTNYTNNTPYEFALTDSSLWSSGYLDVLFQSADGSTGNGPKLYWLETGPDSYWRNLIKHIEWDTTGVVWQMGYYDGTGNEFNGSGTGYTVGSTAIATLSNTGPMTIHWSQAPASGKNYILLAGIIGGSGNNTVTVNGTTVINRGADREKIHDADITAQLVSGNNTAVVTPASGGTIDFVALLEITPGSTSDSNLRVVFKGNELADDWTKLVNTTMFFNNNLLFDSSTGDYHIGLPNGQFATAGYWDTDAGPTVFEMAKWGLGNLAKQATNTLATASDYYSVDNGSSGYTLAAIAYLIKADNYSGTYASQKYPLLEDGLNYFANQVANNPNNLIQGNNYENSNDSYNGFDNSMAYYALLAGSDVASHIGNSTDANNWSSAASTLQNAITHSLILSSNDSAYGVNLPAGTFRYGLSGSNPSVDTDQVYAEWWTIGQNDMLYYGLKGTDPSIQPWKDAISKMLDYHPQNLWTGNWNAYGDNRGLGTNYGALSERASRSTTDMLMLDHMGMFEKNLDHVIWNMSDLNFPNGDNESRVELSPWGFTREISTNDTGLGNDGSGGNGGINEDLQGIEYTEPMQNARIMAGVDDSLTGSDNLVIMPRLPQNWSEVDVNSWPVSYVNGSNISNTSVSYTFTNAPTQGTINATAANAVNNVQFRFGPFEPGSTVANALVNGSNASYSIQDSGDSRWVWVTTNVGTSNTAITVNVTPPGLLLSENFNNGTIPAGWTSNGGTWSDPGSVAQVVTSGDAWNTYTSTFQDGSLAADVKLNGSGSSRAGISFSTNNSGTLGYSLVLDQSAGKLRLLRDNSTEVASLALNIVSNRTYRLKVVASGSSISCYLDGVLTFEATDSTYAGGQFGLYGNNGTLQFDNVLAESSPQSATLQFQGNSFTASNNVQINQSCTDGSGAVCINYIQNGSWAKYSNVDLSDSLPHGTPQRFWFRVASGGSGGNIEIRADNQSTGPIVGTCGIPSTGGWNTWQTVGCDISSNTLTGTHDLYLNFNGASGYLFDLHWFAFKAQTAPDQVEASTFSQVNNIQTNQSCTDAPGAVCINYIQNGSWARYNSVDLTNVPQNLAFRVTSGTTGGTIQVRADNQASGPILGTCTIPGTGGWNTWQTINCTINSKALTGTHDLYLNISGGSGYLFDLHWFAFEQPVPPSPIAASGFSQENSVQTNPLCTDGIGAVCVNYIQNGSWIEYSGVDLTGGLPLTVPNVFWFRVTGGASGGTIQIRADNQTSGPIISTCTIPGTGNWNSWQTISCDASGNTLTGTHDLYLNISGGSGYLFDLHWFAFGENG